MKFQTRLVLFFAFLFVLALGLRYFLTWQYEKRQITDFNSDIRNIIKITHFATHKLLSSTDRDRNALTRFISEAVKEHQALKQISIVNIHQEIVASSNLDLIGKLSEDAREKAKTGGTLHDEATKDWYEIGIPIYSDEKVIGHIIASVVLSDATETLREINLKNIAITIVLFLIISLVSYFGIKKLSKPLADLVEVSRRVAAGDFNARIQLPGSDEHAEVANAFNTMTEKLGEQRDLEEKIHSLEQKTILTETAATLAHEIRNPLNLINLTAGHLGSEYLPPELSERENYLKLIGDLKEQVRHLNKMVENFLAMGRPVKLNLTKVHLKSLWDQIELLSKQEIISKEIKLKLDFSKQLTIRADLEQMRLVLLNVLLNAIAMSSPGETITIEGEKSEGETLIHIRDKGPGIPANNLERVFEPYFSTRKTGTGLGLTLARRLVQEHGGKIMVRNNPDKGTTFTIQIPS